LDRSAELRQYSEAAPFGADVTRDIEEMMDFSSFRHKGARAPFTSVTLLGAFLAFVAAGDAHAQPRQAPNVDSQSHQPTPAAAKPAANVSKFEARRFRHACLERANEKALRGAERETYLSRCFFGRAATRGARRECAKQGAAKGLEKAALHDFVRECVKEQRAHVKQGE
jgi:hypothetical protein